MDILDEPAIRGNGSVELGKYQAESGSSTDHTPDQSNRHVPSSHNSQAPMAAESHVPGAGNDDSNHAQELQGVRRDMGLEPTGLKRGLDERHVNMIAFSSVVGVGLFLQSGRVIYLAGPGLAWIAYVLMGTILWSVMACLGEMTALFPVPGAIFQMPCRFVDASIGYAVGWMSWFAWVVTMASEVDAIASMFNFKFTSDYLTNPHPPFPNPPVNYPHDSLEWSTNGTNPAVWVTIFLLIIFIINFLPVRMYGEIEYVVGVLKMLFIVGLIMFNIVINVQSGTGFEFYRSPWGFVSANFVTWKGPVHGDTYHGSVAHLAGMWSAMTVTIFSMIGWETISVTAAENRDFEAREGIKLASRKISLRIILLYTISVFVVGLNVPYTDPNIVNPGLEALGGGQHSAFIVAAVRAGKVGWPNFMNAFFILSATSAGVNALYISSRILHALALEQQAWPSWGWASRLRQRLVYTTRHGVPRNAVIVSGAFGLLGYLAAGSSPSTNLGRMAINSTVSMLITYAVICAAFLSFKKNISNLAHSRPSGRAQVDRLQDRNAFRRKAITYPYRSHGQPLRAYYALFGCVTMAFFNGWRSLSPFSGGDFVASYISVFVFLAISIAYHISLQGWYPGSWRLHPTADFSNPTMIPEALRNPARGDLFFPDRLPGRKITVRNANAARNWLWVWLK